MSKVVSVNWPRSAKFVAGDVLVAIVLVRRSIVIRSLVVALVSKSVLLWVYVRFQVGKLPIDPRLWSCKGFRTLPRHDMQSALLAARTRAFIYTYA